MGLSYTDLMKGSGGWIGGQGSSSSRIWNWVDKTEFRYSNWYTGQPDERSEACVDVSIFEFEFIIIEVTI